MLLRTSTRTYREAQIILAAARCECTNPSTVPSTVVSCCCLSQLDTRCEVDDDHAQSQRAPLTESAGRGGSAGRLVRSSVGGSWRMPIGSRRHRPLLTGRRLRCFDKSLSIVSVHSSNILFR